MNADTDRAHAVVPAGATALDSTRRPRRRTCRPCDCFDHSERAGAAMRWRHFKCPVVTPCRRKRAFGWACRITTVRRQRLIGAVVARASPLSDAGQSNGNRRRHSVLVAIWDRGRLLRHLGFADPFRTLPPTPALKRACRLVVIGRAFLAPVARELARGGASTTEMVCVSASPADLDVGFRVALVLRQGRCQPADGRRVSGGRRVRGAGSLGICGAWERSGASLVVVGARPPRGLGRTGSQRRADPEATGLLLRPR